ncbi:glycosyltransferase family 2 protein [Mycoplasmopsis caviae]|uniref:Glycosyltransferase family 2 protein n=1 Tax=Mycoplasmopsis caviae TaxID=55603 RepID=A0A3P8KX89_9BACT|nr:glycosyltransferase family 2 protein [Mycoplasmopsis caviae]UUD34997.1 glycosyltransferase family 2 protein [Mycoplasmopsis caviae]VDR42177.1 N-glycosyltransferase [Mycoplasmopsis caviae]
MEKLNLSTVIIGYITLGISILFFLIFFLQIAYTFLALFIKNKKFKKTDVYNNHAILIPAHNEGHIIADLVKSLKAMDYPADKFKVFVVADNCTDNTADVAREAGADKVYERFNKELIGPNFAIHETLLKIKDEFGTFDSFSWFDADNIVEKEWLSKMNDAFNHPKKYDYFTSFRDTQNFEDNWISSSYSIEFYRLVSQIATVRSVFKNPHMVGGTGFMVRWEILEKNDYWGKYKSMVHDTEFSFDALSNNYKGIYVDGARFYDLQPTKMSVSWKQRTRWTVGNLKLGHTIWGKIFKNLFFKFEAPQKKLNYLDYIAMLSPAWIWFVVLFIFNTTLTVLNGVLLGFGQVDFWKFLGVLSLPLMFVWYYLSAWFMGLAVIIRQCKKMKRISGWSKFKALFGYPIFLFLNVPISIYAQKNINMKFVNTKKERSTKTMI